MAELMRKFFEMNDTDVLIVAVLYFTSVIVGWIYCCKKWRKEDEENKGQGRNKMDVRRGKLFGKKHGCRRRGRSKTSR